MRIARHSAVGRALSEECETGEFSSICRLLGCTDPYWVGVLERIAYSAYDVSLALPDNPEDCWTPSVDLLDSRNACLVPVPGGELPMVEKCTAEPESWPSGRTAEVTLENGMARIRYAGREDFARVLGTYGGASVVDWPVEYGLHGALNAVDGETVKIRLKPVYPSDFVISLVKSDDLLYTLLTGTGYAEAFYCKTGADAKLAVLVLALYKHHIADV